MQDKPQTNALQAQEAMNTGVEAAANPNPRAPGLAAFQIQPAGLCQPADLLGAGGAQPVCRAAVQRQAAHRALRGQTYLPLLHDYPETTFGGDFHTPTDYLDPFIRQRLGEGDNWAIFPSTAMASPPSTTLPSRPTLLRRRPTTGWAPTTGGAICWRSSSTVFASACCSAWR
jgi:hypothetical protein